MNFVHKNGDNSVNVCGNILYVLTEERLIETVCSELMLFTSLSLVMFILLSFERLLLSI